MSDQAPGDQQPTIPSMGNQPSGTPAGWYPDPQNPGQQRYWDGSAWSAPAPKTSTMAIVGLVLAIVSWVICPIIAAIAALIVARSSSQEIKASEGRIEGAGLNTATRIIAWINIGVMAVATVVLVILTVLGVGLFAQVASTVDPAVNSQTGLADGAYVMDPSRTLYINDACTFGGSVYTPAQVQVADTTVYGLGGTQCGDFVEVTAVYFEVRGGVAKILRVEGTNS